MKIETHHLIKRYGERTVVNDVNVEVEQGTVVGLLGPNGAGKTTLFNLLTGVYEPSEGKIELNVDGQMKSIGGLKPYVITGLGLARTFQNIRLFKNMTVLDNAAFGMELAGVAAQERQEKALDALRQVGLENYAHAWPDELSGGMRQRAALLRTYLCSEGAALLDEPFSALDALTKASIHRWYLEVMEQIELSTLFITHDIDEAILLSDRIYLLSGKPGHITAELNLHKESRPRGDFTLTSQFLEYKKEILSLLQF